jgi:hypothetical protein
MPTRIIFDNDWGEEPCTRLPPVAGEKCGEGSILSMIYALIMGLGYGPTAHHSPAQASGLGEARAAEDQVPYTRQNRGVLAKLVGWP